MSPKSLDLLPSNALRPERALSLAVEFSDDILPEDIKSLWRPKEAASRFLPFMAWGLHLDFWDDNLNEDVKRSLILGSFTWHRKKGTVWAVRHVLESLDFCPTITEWFELPPGARPHTFSIRGHFQQDPHNLQVLGPNTENLLLSAVFEAKPERSHLLFLVVAPPPPDRTHHRCRWDYCTWEHGVRYAYKWEDTGLDEALCPEAELIIGISNNTLSTGVYTRGPRWDASHWEDGVWQNIKDQVGRSTLQSMTGFLDSILEAPPRRKWTDHRTWRGGGTWLKYPEPPSGGSDIFFTEE